MATRRRAPDPARQLAGVREQLQRGWPPGLTVLTGTDVYHLDRAQEALLRELAGDATSGFGVTVYGAEKVDLSMVVAAARSVGMFSQRRVVFIRDLAVLDGDPEALGEYAGDPPRDSFLIVRAPVLDQRRKLHKILGSAGRLLEFAAVDPFDRGRLTAAVRAMAEERGLRLDRATAELLAELGGGELIRLAGELDKIRAWLGPDDKRVTVDVVREVAAGSGMLSGWEVADAVLRRDRPAALAAVRRLVEAGDEPLRIVGGLAWRARVMLQAKALLGAGRRADEVVRATRAWYYKEELLEGLSRYSLDELRAFPAALLDADRTLKSRSLAAGAVLEQLVDGLIGRAGERR